MNIKVAVITDGGTVPRFGLDALNALVGCEAVTVFACTNSRSARKPVKHGAYYLLNLLSLRNQWTRGVPLASGTKRIERVVDFESDYEGAWQSLPEAVVEQLRDGGFDIVVKLGMGLLRIPPPERLPVPILSWHHGDPDLYRGRPAGFWEMVEGRCIVGQIIQVLGNRLDGGKVVAFAETRVLPYSYRGTMAESFRHSSLLINEAVRNAISGTYLPKPCTGKNYRLPSNATVAAFFLRMMWEGLKRVSYAVTLEKKWKVSVARSDPDGLARLVQGASFPAPDEWRTVPTGRRYAFYADPFFSEKPRGLLVEALSRRSGLGEVVLIEGDRHSPISDGRGHYSYPSTIQIGGRQLVLPETGLWSSTRLFEVVGGRLADVGALKVAGAPRIVDPTLVEHDGRLYLFGSPQAYGTNILNLWTAAGIDDQFEPHPANPLRVSPIGARMAGGLVRVGGRLIRFGQSFERSYGDGIVVFEIEAMTPDTYREKSIGEIRFRDRIGPHTLNVREGELVFDWYRHRLDPLVGLRRTVGRIMSLTRGPGDGQNRRHAGKP